VTPIHSDIDHPNEPVFQTDAINTKRVFLHLKTKKDDTDYFEALYDTGACVSLLSVDDFNKFKRANRVMQQVRVRDPGVTNASGGRMESQGTFIILFYLQGRLCQAPFIVCSEIGHSILGMNIISNFNLKIDFFTMNVAFGAVAGRTSPPPPLTPQQVPTVQVVSEEVDETDGCEARVVQRTIIEPQEGRLVKCALFKEGKKVDKKLECLVHMDLISVSVITSEQGIFQVHLPNASPFQRVFERGEKVGMADQMSDYVRLTEQEAVANVSEVSARTNRVHTREETESIRKELQENVNRTVPYQYRGDYMNTLMKYSQFFSADKHDLGLADIFQHDIELGDKEPVYTPQFRLPFEQLDFIKSNVAGWIQSGIVEKTASKYNSPIFCVPKKEGRGLRCVLDYRRVNSKSLADKYSIRTIDQCLEEIGAAGSRIFSALDLTNGFWQLKLKEESRPYTAFTIPGKGQYRWKTCPQGIMGGPASFSRLMDVIMADATNVITYIDDVLIHSATHKDHLGHLAEAIRRVGKANLRLNAAKCIFGAAEVTYLGHTLTSTGVKPGKDKSAALVNVLPPTNQKQLKSFAGLANYFRGYIKNFSVIAAPLFQLTRQTSIWKEGHMPEDALEAFHKIKKLIASRPLMQYPKRQGTFHLFVDAALGDSKNIGGLGAVLMQTQPDGHKAPVGFASRRLLKHEGNYPTFLAEIQAAVFGMEFFHHYLVGRRFNLYTDHKPMLRLSHAKLSPVHMKTLERLQLKMQDMHPEIRYVEGKNNTVADFLSRYQGMNVAMVDTAPVRINVLQQEDLQIRQWMIEADAAEKIHGLATKPSWLRLPRRDK
jgi:hypothetical protein